MPKRTVPHPDQLPLDLFPHERLYPVQVTKDLGSAMAFNARMALAMSRALDEAALNGLVRAEVAHRMSQILGIEISKAMLDKYTSQAAETHTISLVRFVAFVRATGCTWLWKQVLAHEGLTILEGEEALLAQAALAQKKADHYRDEARRLKHAAPFQVGAGDRA